MTFLGLFWGFFSNQISDLIHFLERRRVRIQMQILPLLKGIELVQLEVGELARVARGAHKVVARVHLLGRVVP